jgi:hypothetical protein
MSTAFIEMLAKQAAQSNLMDGYIKGSMAEDMTNQGAKLKDIMRTATEKLKDISIDEPTIKVPDINSGMKDFTEGLANMVATQQNVSRHQDQLTALSTEVMGNLALLDIPEAQQYSQAFGQSIHNKQASAANKLAIAKSYVETHTAVMDYKLKTMNMEEAQLRVEGIRNDDTSREYLADIVSTPEWQDLWAKVTKGSPVDAYAILATAKGKAKLKLGDAFNEKAWNSAVGIADMTIIRKYQLEYDKMRMDERLTYIRNSQKSGSSTLQSQEYIMESYKYMRDTTRRLNSYYAPKTDEQKRAMVAYQQKARDLGIAEFLPSGQKNPKYHYPIDPTALAKLTEDADGNSLADYVAKDFVHFADAFAGHDPLYWQYSNILETAIDQSKGSGYFKKAAFQSKTPVAMNIQIGSGQLTIRPSEILISNNNTTDNMMSYEWATPGNVYEPMSESYVTRITENLDKSFDKGGTFKGTPRIGAVENPADVAKTKKVVNDKKKPKGF